MTTLALDLGTTTARAGVFDATGRRLATATATLDTHHRFPGAVEQDPSALASVAIDLVREVLTSPDVDTKQVENLGIANQRATVVAWDARTGDPIGPAIGWQDTRTAPQCAEFRAQGIPLTTSASCSKLQWLMANDSAVTTAARAGTLRLGTVDTWLTWVLSGGRAHVTDPSNAGATGLYDVRAGDWSDGALSLFEVPRDPLATVVGTDEMVATTAKGVVGAEIALRARAGDQQAAAAAHHLRAGEAKLTLGTSAMLDLALGPEPLAAPEGCYTLPLWRRGGVDAFMVEGSVHTAGAVMEWLVRIGVLPAVDLVDRLARAGRSGVDFVPALAGLGSPHQDPDARATIGGLGLDTGPAEIVRGALAGIANRVAEVVTTMGITGEVRVDGGLSRSEVLCELISAATGLTVHRARDPETTLLGAAILASADPIPRATYG